MTLDHGAHDSVLTKDLDFCHRAPEEHIRCLVDVSEEQAHAPAEIIVKSGQLATWVYRI